jgi:cystathionine beta-lyase/cystathionine gamma-synthase
MKELIHPPGVELPAGNTPVIAPIYQSAKFALGEGDLGPQYIYSRISNPTLKQLELTITAVAHREDTVVFASGMGAISGALMGLLQKGDHIIGFKESYKPARVFIRQVLPKFGIDSDVLSIKDCPNLEKWIRPGQTKIIYFENISNPHSLPAPIETLFALAKKHQITLVMDGTLTGIHQGLWPEVDVVVHSLTKYANGHGDVIAGSVSGKADLIKKIRTFAIFQGASLDPHAAYLIQRGLKTYKMRFKQHSDTSLAVAQFLAKHPKIKNVFYPGLHEKSLFSEMGGVMCFELDSQVGNAWDFCHRFDMIQFAVSLGSTETLICPTEMFFADDLSPEEKKLMGMNPYTVRLCIGLEDSEEIIKELKTALN